MHDKRGNSKDRRRRKEWMLETFGDGITCECSFDDCNEMLTYETLTADRWPVPGAQGGRYIRSNVRPACLGCNMEDGLRIQREMLENV